MKSDPFNQESITIEDNKVFLWYGRPNHPHSTRIDVTMAFNLGMNIALKRYDRIQAKNLIP